MERTFGSCFQFILGSSNKIYIFSNSLHQLFILRNSESPGKKLFSENLPDSCHVSPFPMSSLSSHQRYYHAQRTPSCNLSIINEVNPLDLTRLRLHNTSIKCWWTANIEIMCNTNISSWIEIMNELKRQVKVGSQWIFPKHCLQLKQENGNVRERHGQKKLHPSISFWQD